MNRLLGRKGIESYLPLVEQVRTWADRKKRVALPLFSGYVFVRFNLTMIHEVLRTAGIVTIVRDGGSPTPVRDDELESVRMLVAGVSGGHAPPQPVEFLQAGQEVIVAEGPFSGIRGVLVEDRGRARVVIRLSALRKALSVEVPRDTLRAAAT